MTFEHDRSDQERQEAAVRGDLFESWPTDEPLPISLLPGNTDDVRRRLAFVARNILETSSLPPGQAAALSRRIAETFLEDDGPIPIPFRPNPYAPDLQ